MADAGAKRVRLVGLPLALHAEMQEHHGSLIRELQLVAVGMRDKQGSAGMAQGLLDLVAAGIEEIEGPDGLAEGLRRAHRHAGPNADVDATVSPSMLRHLEQEFAIFEQLESMARADAILTEPPSSEVKRLRAWMLDELRGQIVEGRAPTPFGATIGV